MVSESFIARFIPFILRHRIGIAVTFLVLILDQITKVAVVRMIPVWESWPEDEFFHFTHATNQGSALGLFSGHTIALTAASLIVIGVLMALYWPTPKTSARPQITFGLILAGAVGNLIDRILFGHVVDFIDILPWFIFNVADIAILFGLVGFSWDIPDVTARLLTEAHKQS